MLLKDRMQKSGNILFRYRSYIPLVIIPLIILSVMSFGQNLYRDKIYNDMLVWIALLVGCLGQYVRILVAGYVPSGTSGRNTHAQVAESLNTTGMYSICRNPLYLGNFLMMIAPVILVGNWLLLLLFCALFYLYYERIMYAEERFLEEKFAEQYLAWAQSVSTFFPSFKNYKPSVLDFSAKTMIKREYHSFFGLTSSLFAANYLIVFFNNFDPAFSPNGVLMWTFIGSAIFYLIVRIIVKKTRFFEVEGR